MSRCTLARRLLLSVAASLAVPSAAAPTPDAGVASAQVRTESGLVEGVEWSSQPRAMRFLGISYAAPPTGARRFAPPQPVVPWRGARSARAFGSSCPQPGGAEAHYAKMMKDVGALPGLAYFAPFRTDEDCLYLNVWQAAGGGAGLHPVLVYLHGGGHTEGSGQTSMLAHTLGPRGVVVVTVNYRLGVLGSLAHPALSAESPTHTSGNYGLSDQVAALGWVQRNIQAFGGDQRRVTVMGESSGAFDTCVLMTSPLARGLFHQAVIQSGGCADIILPERAAVTTFTFGRGSAEADGVTLASRLGLDGGAGVLAGLRSIPAARLLAAAGAEPSLDALGTSVDGTVLVEQPAVAFAAGRQAPIPVVVGYNRDEGTMFTSPADQQTPAAYRGFVEAFFPGDAEAILAAYPPDQGAGWAS